MAVIKDIHAIFGERVLPILILAVAIWLTIVWKQNTPLPRLARLFPILVDIQATLGVLLFVFSVASRPDYLTLPFLLHPILGLFSAGIGHMAVKPRGPFARMGRWAPLAALGVLLVSVIAGLVVVRTLA